MRNFIVIFAVLASAALAYAAGKEMMREAPHVIPAELKWVTPFGPEGPQVAVVEGQFGDKKPCSFFAKFAPGMQAPWHYHDNDYESVVLTGTFTEQQLGKSEVQLPAGTWAVQPGDKQVHKNGCTKDAECIVFIHYAKGANSVITDEKGKPLPPPAAPAQKKM
jgi:hypothetical protein